MAKIKEVKAGKVDVAGLRKALNRCKRMDFNRFNMVGWNCC
jgi:predicted RecB family endonuclease